MIIQNVPFYSNTPDDTHCFQAVLKMVLKYFQPEKYYSFEQLDKLSDNITQIFVIINYDERNKRNSYSSS